jgi:hypothetical protein
MKKFSGRRKARNHATDFSVMRPSIVDMVVSAKRRLTDAPSCGAADGLGLCALSTKDSERGLAAYTDFVQLYALQVQIHTNKYRNSPYSHLSPPFMIACLNELWLLQGLLYVLLQAQTTHSAEGQAALLHASRQAVSASLQPRADIDAISSLQRDVQLFRMSSSSSSSQLTPPPAYIITESHRIDTLTHQLAIFGEEFPVAAAHLEDSLSVLWPSSTEKGVVAYAGMTAALSRLVQLAAQHASAVQHCRARDAQKGCAVISDYLTVNAVAVDVTKDAVVSEALERARDIDQAVKLLMGDAI